MAKKTVEFEGKIKIKKEFNAKNLLQLLKYLSDEQGFTINKLESDEIKLIKNDFLQEQEGDLEITKSNINVEIEIEVSDHDVEVEVKSESFDLVKNLTLTIAGRL